MSHYTSGTAGACFAGSPSAVGQEQKPANRPNNNTVLAAGASDVTGRWWPLIAWSQIAITLACFGLQAGASRMGLEREQCAVRQFESCFCGCMSSVVREIWRCC